MSESNSVSCQLEVESCQVESPVFPALPPCSSGGGVPVTVPRALELLAGGSGALPLRDGHRGPLGEREVEMEATAAQHPLLDLRVVLVERVVPDRASTA
jgi:hypothetical protein